MDNEALLKVKQRFGIIGNAGALNQALDLALQVAPTDMSVLVLGESGAGKEFIPRVIHEYSPRKHGPYQPVNCAGIPEGTIDSELFGHEKGAFTGAIAERKGYFEEADGGTIFLDEVADLPLSTQARLLRVLEYGEYKRVGSSKVQKTNVRVVAATNKDLSQAIKNNQFRADLYYRLSAMTIHVPSLRERPDDIAILFRKFISDVCYRYKMPSVNLSQPAKELLLSYRWPGNVRELKNVADQVAVKASADGLTEVGPEVLRAIFTNAIDTMPAVYHHDSIGSSDGNYATEREILYKVLFDMKKDMRDLKELVNVLMRKNNMEMPTAMRDASYKTWQPLLENSEPSYREEQSYGPAQEYEVVQPSRITSQVAGQNVTHPAQHVKDASHIQEAQEYVEEALSLDELEKQAIKKALERNNGRRKDAAADLNISERTLYRKITQYNLG